MGHDQTFVLGKHGCVMEDELEMAKTEAKRPSGEL